MWYIHCKKCAYRLNTFWDAFLVPFFNAYTGKTCIKAKQYEYDTFLYTFRPQGVLNMFKFYAHFYSVAVWLPMGLKINSVETGEVWQTSMATPIFRHFSYCFFTLSSSGLQPWLKTTSGYFLFRYDFYLVFYLFTCKKNWSAR